MGEPRYVIIHGHFYQPPRESPWTGLISPEASAAPFPNWNERILSECYTANAHAHTMDGTVVHVRNNYESMSFDFGPTLASWLERHGKAAYRAIRRGDELSRADHGGHGNAIAQSYNHSILPLLSARDRELQIAWGMQDFVYRFGNQPEGIWLPECAVDDDTLESVAAAGLKFTILAGDQGRFTGGTGSTRTAGPFIWRSGDLSLAIFRFDRELSTEISFTDALKDGAGLANRIAQVALEQEPGSAILIATDGETFGHHKKSGAAELARVIMTIQDRDDIVITNLSDYLASHPSAGSFESAGPSAWSCAHGVERWRSNCGCRFDANTSQEWRTPFFDAMTFVNNHTLAIYDRFAPELSKNHAALLRESMRLLGDPSAMLQEEFFHRHQVADERSRDKLLLLFEIVRAGQASMTSCAWFFDDFGGLEGRVALRWAARAVELSAEFAASIEAELLERLRDIKSNRREIADAATLYLSLKTREARGRI
jgi:alpha-amylase/alpha-mannosidase (GH57 family)